jgi:hypothetical protein
MLNPNFRHFLDACQSMGVPSNSPQLHGIIDIVSISTVFLNKYLLIYPEVTEMTPSAAFAISPSASSLPLVTSGSS